MKKILISTLIAVMVGATLTGCGNKNTGNSSATEQGAEQVSSVSAKEVVDKLKDEGYVRMPAEVDDAMAKEIYHLNLDDIENYGILETQISPGPGLIIVAKAKDGKIDAVKASMEEVLKDKIGNAFYPEEKEVIEKAEVKVNGNLVSLFILNSEVASDAESKYNELIK